MSSLDGNLQERLARVRERVAAACEKARRDPAGVRILAVSKTVPEEGVREALRQCGLTDFGENYIQEAVEKIESLRALPLQWHCIGPVQSNKTRLVAEHFDWVQTVDRLKIAQRLSEQRPAGRAPLQICIQVNIDGGPTKAGVAPEDAAGLARAVAALPNLALRGLMAIPDPAPGYPAQLAVHGRLKALFDQLRAASIVPAAQWDTLSIGMSDDLEAAVAAGSTMLRIGSAIFGPRG